MNIGRFTDADRRQREKDLESFRCTYRFDGPGDGLRRSHADSHDSPRCNRHVYPYAHHCKRSNTGSHPDANTCTNGHIYYHADPDTHSNADRHTCSDTHSSPTRGLVLG